jgi:hypothetical protein
VIVAAALAAALSPASAVAAHSSQQAGLPLPADAAAEGPSGGATTIESLGQEGRPWLAFPGFSGEPEHFHAPPPIGTFAFGSSPVGPALHKVWRQPLATLATWA